jgi:hypothetical protein
MNTSISIGGRVLPVSIVRTDTGFSASFADRFLGEPRAFTAAGDTYEAALGELRNKILAARIF